MFVLIVAFIVKPLMTSVSVLQLDQVTVLSSIILTEVWSGQVWPELILTFDLLL